MAAAIISRRRRRPRQKVVMAAAAGRGRRSLQASPASAVWIVLAAALAPNFLGFVAAEDEAPPLAAVEERTLKKEPPKSCTNSLIYTTKIFISPTFGEIREISGDF